MDQAPQDVVVEVGAAFSGGEMKRLSIVYALTLGRRGIILDAPTNGLNDEIVERLLTTLREYRSTRTWVAYAL
ncbi:hypothetical protein FPH17_07810 [Corynebacterium godavarianum]|uniref:ATP-binding cassette domain-containing protein n=1 Tax=Corynebacterium godavarianum TaxID=2054421 RepID=A0ABY3E130_9CORY|nr:hypothetical protein [Corynebacterium godavarianum]MBL7285190.1 hypothetical protein [Corynebacterium godavarianum]TSJ73302.1 hypothetical protein FPH17_07810 [Corynebacterium godavarianum]